MPTDNSSLLNVTVTATLMEDYVPGVPLTAPAYPLERLIAFAASDGSIQILNLGRTDDAKVWRVFRAPDSVTGWSADSMGMGRSLVVNTGGVPRGVILENRRLLMYRGEGLQEATVNLAGSITGVGEPLPNGPRGTIPLVTGPQASGTRYIPEMLAQTDPSAARFILRDVSSGQWQNVEGSPFSAPDPGNNNPLASPKVFPLLTESTDSYAFVSLDKANTKVIATLLALDPSSGNFTAVETSDLGHTDYGCAYVQQSAPGKADVVIFNQSGMTKLSGSYDPNVPKSISWVADPAAVFPEDFQMPKFPDGCTFKLDGFSNPDIEAIEVFLSVVSPGTDAPMACEIWTTAWTSSEGWRKPALLDRGCTVIAALPAARNALVVYRHPTADFEIWQRNEAGDFDQDPIDMPGDEGLQKIACYRVGISLAQGDEPLMESLGCTASEAFRGIVNGDYSIIPHGQPLPVAADVTGMIWVTVPMQQRLGLPSLYLSSTRFAGQRLELRLNDRIEEYMKTVKSDDLSQAADPSDGQKLLADAADAGEAAEAINNLMKAAPAPAPKAAAPQNVSVTANCNVQWLDMSAPRPAPVRAAALPSWRLESESGKPRLTMLTPQEAQARMAQLNAAHRLVPMGLGIPFVDDAIDAIGGLARDIYEGVVSVGRKAAELVVDGINITVHLVIDGLDYVYNGILDTIDRVMDALSFVLDHFGFIIGKAVRWLLKQLGFLFDWEKILEIRNAFKKTFTDGLGPALTRLGDPAVTLGSLKTRLDTVHNDVRTGLAGLRSSPQDKDTMGKYASRSSPLTSYFSVLGGASVLPEATWLLDKLRGALPKFKGPLADLDIPGFDGMQLAIQAATVATSLAPTTGDLVTLADSWIRDGDLFRASTFDPFIDIAQRHLDQFFQALGALIDQGAAGLHAVWSNPQQITAWLDSPLQIPFFRGFYEGLTDNEPSMLDIVCLAAAIMSYTAGRLPIPVTAAAGPLGVRTLAASATTIDLDKVEEAGHWFMVASIFTTFASATAAAMNPAGSKYSHLFTGFDICATAGFLITHMIEHNELWEDVSAGVALAAGLVLLAVKWDKRGDLARCISPVLCIYHMVHWIVSAAQNRPNEALGMGIGMVQNAINMGMEAYKRDKNGNLPLDPQRAAIYGMVQCFLTEARELVYLKQPLTGAAQA
jgi:hypothetical protein